MWECRAGNGCKDYPVSRPQTTRVFCRYSSELIGAMEEKATVTLRVLRKTFVTLSMQFWSDYDKHLRLAV